MHVGIANPRWWGKRSRHSRRKSDPQFYVSGKRPIVEAGRGHRHSAITDLVWQQPKRLLIEAVSMRLPWCTSRAIPHNDIDHKWMYTHTINLAITLSWLYMLCIELPHPQPHPASQTNANMIRYTLMDIQSDIVTLILSLICILPNCYLDDFFWIFL